MSSLYAVFKVHTKNRMFFDRREEIHRIFLGGYLSKTYILIIYALSSRFSSYSSFKVLLQDPQN